MPFILTADHEIVSLFGGQFPQIREQLSGPDLYVFTLKFLALKNLFFHFLGVKKIYKKGIMQLFSADGYSVFKKKI